MATKPWRFTIEVDSGGNELPGDWEYDPESGCVYCSVG